MVNQTGEEDVIKKMNSDNRPLDYFTLLLVACFCNVVRIYNMMQIKLFAVVNVKALQFAVFN